MISWRPRAALLLCALLAALGVGRASAQVADLSWSAPRACPQREAVARRLVALLAGGSSKRSDLSVRGRVRRDPTGRYTLALALRTSDYSAERSLDSRSCNGVTDAGLWLVMVALTQSEPPATEPVAQAPSQVTPRADVVGPATDAPGSALASASAPASGPRADEVVAKAADAVSVARRPTTPASAPSAGPLRSSFSLARPRWWRAGLFTGVWSAGLPGPQASAGARAGLGFRLLYAELHAAWESARSTPIAPGAQSTFRSQDVGLALCALWGKRLRGGLCGNAALLRTSGRAELPAGQEQALLWAAAGPSLQLGARLYRGLELMLEGGLESPISKRPRFTVDGLGEIASARALGGYARLGIGYRSLDTVRGK